MSRLLNFYDGTGTDAEGRRLEEVWSWNDGELEAVHDFIQWLFPLPEPSRFNPDAPLLTERDIAAFRTDETLRANLRRSFERILTFLGLVLSADGKVVEGPNFSGRAREVWAYPNHNWLRITRILRSLRLLGLEDEARALYERLAEFHRALRFPIAADTFRYWTEAIGGTAFPR
jgi:Opioid growth factor receptor (OGFr) conserved region